MHSSTAARLAGMLVAALTAFASLPGAASAAADSVPSADATAASVASAGATAPAPLAGPSPCGQGSWVAGTVELCAGELVYRDYVYDDHGSGLGPGTGSLPVPPPGDADGESAFGWVPPTGRADEYGGRQPDDLADLIALRVRILGEQLRVDAELNTMFAPDLVRVTLGIDTDGDPRTAAGPTWPGLVADPFTRRPLSNTGIDRFVTLSGGDPATNLLSATLPVPGGRRWRLQAVTSDSSGIIRNVAFRGPDERGAWWDARQANALAAGDISAFTQPVEVGDLTARRTRRTTVSPGQVRQRVYVSAFNPGAGEGISAEGVAGPGATPGDPNLRNSQAFTMLGRYQPYGFYEPVQAGPHGLQLVLHGLGENHSARLQSPSGRRARFLDHFGEERNRLLASPLGRGYRGWYSSYSERDVLDVLADVRANYPVDDDRSFISGYSMGGYGALRLAALHPDLFAATVSFVGWTGDEFNGTPLAGQGGSSAVGSLGNALDLLGNLRHVPVLGSYAAGDELVLLPQAQALWSGLRSRGYPAILYLHAGEHLTLAIADYWVKESDWTAPLVRLRDPSRITFRTDRRFFAPELGIVPDRAYWVSSVSPAGPGYADVDAISWGCGRADPQTAELAGAGIDPVPWTSRELAVVGTTHQAPAAKLQLAVANVASLRVDTGDAAAGPGKRGACLGSRPVSYHVTTDRAVTLSFSDGRSLSFPRAGIFEGLLPGVERPAGQPS